MEKTFITLINCIRSDEPGRGRSPQPGFFSLGQTRNILKRLPGSRKFPKLVPGKLNMSQTHLNRMGHRVTHVGPLYSNCTLTFPGLQQCQGFHERENLSLLFGGVVDVSEY